MSERRVSARKHSCAVGHQETEKAQAVGLLCLWSCSGNGFQPSIPQQASDRGSWYIPKPSPSDASREKYLWKEYIYLQRCLPQQLPHSGVSKISFSLCGHSTEGQITEPTPFLHPHDPTHHLVLDQDLWLPCPSHKSSEVIHSTSIIQLFWEKLLWFVVSSALCALWERKAD